MNILVKFPTRSRPQKFFETLLKYQTLRSTNKVKFLVTIDGDDVTMTNGRTIDILKQWGNLKYEIVSSAGKIAAINSGVNEYDEEYDILVLASDDMIPQFYGWDQVIIDEMNDHYPDTDGVLWFNDGYAGKKLNTLSIMGKKYYDRFKYIYHPSYKSLWCDNEFMDVANKLGKQTYIDRVIIKHEHPIWNSSTRNDTLNFRDQQNFTIDQENYERRKQSNFDIDSIVIDSNTNTEVKSSKTTSSDEPNRESVKKRGRRKSTNMHSV